MQTQASMRPAHAAGAQNIYLYLMQSFETSRAVHGKKIYVYYTFYLAVRTSVARAVYDICRCLCIVDILCVHIYVSTNIKRKWYAVI